MHDRQSPTEKKNTEEAMRSESPLPEVGLTSTHKAIIHKAIIGVSTPPIIQWLLPSSSSMRAACSPWASWSTEARHWSSLHLLPWALLRGLDPGPRRGPQTEVALLIVPRTSSFSTPHNYSHNCIKIRCGLVKFPNSNQSMQETKCHKTKFLKI